MKRLFGILFSVLLCVQLLWAVPAKRGIRLLTQPDGSRIEAWLHGDEVYSYLTDADGRLLEQDEAGWYRTGDRPTSESIRAKRMMSPLAGADRLRRIGTPNLAPRGLFILVNFTDSVFRQDNSLQEMNLMLNQQGYNYGGSKGSARDYFIEQSGGTYSPQFDVYGPVNLSHPESYYGANSNNKQGADMRGYQMVIDACGALDSQVDFSLYDSDNDGQIDFVYVIYAGMGEADGGAPSTIWPHQWYVYTGAGVVRRYDSKTLNNYACGPELNGDGQRCGIGTLVHEFGHVLGLPDYYDTESGDNYLDGLTPNEWNVMDYGPYNGNGYCPPNYAPHDKYFLGWAQPTLLDTAENVVLPADNNTYRYITANGNTATARTEGLVYYIENRQLTGWDEYLPGHGMLVWKVNYKQSVWADNKPNNTTGAPRYTLVSASGNTTNIGLCHTAGFSAFCNQDPFPGAYGTTEFYPFLTDGQETTDCLYPVTDITETDGMIGFKFMVGVSPATAVDETAEENGGCRKVMRNGVIYIERFGTVSDVLGRKIKK